METHICGGNEQPQGAPANPAQPEYSPPQPAQPVNANTDVSSQTDVVKKYWYTFFLPILFFLPLSDKEYKEDKRAKELATALLWIIIIIVAVPTIGAILGYIPIIGGIARLVLCLVPTAIGIFSIISAIKARDGELLKLPVVGDIAIFK